MKLTLTSILKAKTTDIQQCLNKITDWKGKDSWLLTPKNKEKKICIVVHIDTVWDEGFSLINKWKKKNKTKKKKRDKKLVHDKEKGLIWSPDGLGADDRAGVYAAIKIFQDSDESCKPFVLFCDYEESGGAGATEASHIFKEDLADCTYFIELDRKGHMEAVFYNFEPDDFIEYIENFGFKENIGSFSDIATICPSLELCGVNLSIGYHGEHTKGEYLNINQMNATIKTVKEMLAHNEKTKKVWVLEDHYGYPIKGKNFESTEDSNDGVYMYDSGDFITCPNCWAQIHKDEVYAENKHNIYCYCNDCGVPIEIDREELSVSRSENDTYAYSEEESWYYNVRKEDMK